MDEEWASWGRDSAREFARRGFAVIRVRSRFWKELKTSNPEFFRHPYKEEENSYQVIRTIVMKDITCPLIQQVVQQISCGTLSVDLRAWDRMIWDLELPPGDGPCTPYLDVVAVTEASSLLAPDVTPQDVRILYRSYSHRLVWAGFNAYARCSGSKLVLGEPEDFAFLKQVLGRLKVWHLDQQYKCFQNSYFTAVCSTLDILVGYRDHVSACCDRHAEADAMLGSTFVPKPDLNRQPSSEIDKVPLPDSVATFIVSSLHNHERCRGSIPWEDTVALRMWSYVLDSESEVRRCEEAIHEHREEMRKLALENFANTAATASRKAAAIGFEDRDLTNTLDRMLHTGEPLPVPLAEETKTDSVLLHVRRKA